MSNFITTLNVDFSPVKDRNKRWKLGKPLKFMRSKYSRSFADSRYLGVITVPIGEHTDFHSIPWVFRYWLVKPIARDAAAAVLHDYLCRAIREGINNGRLYDHVTGFPEVITRQEADLIYKDAMECCNSNWFKRRLKYFGVKTYTRWLKFRGKL